MDTHETLTAVREEVGRVREEVERGWRRCEELLWKVKGCCGMAAEEQELLRLVQAMECAKRCLGD